MRFSYDAPPPGEVTFAFRGAGAYAREIRCCDACGHCVSVDGADRSRMYEGDYVTSNYSDDAGIAGAYERVLALDPARSDNSGRVERVCAFAAGRWPDGRRTTLLDIGSGLGVFVHAMKAAGFECTALDPDERAARHALERVGVASVHADFMHAGAMGPFDLITLNKVLEHVPEPVAMLRKAAAMLTPRGFIYVEVPDAEAAASAGKEREEFFIDHLHIFSAASLAMLAARAGVRAARVERITEPSGKFTLRGFLEVDP